MSEQYVIKSSTYSSFTGYNVNYVSSFNISQTNVEIKFTENINDAFKFHYHTVGTALAILELVSSSHSFQMELVNENN